MKIVLDTNVFISGIFWSGPPYQILQAWKANKIQLVASPEILNEYDQTSKILSKQYPGVDLSPFIELLAIYAQIHVPTFQFSEQISRDPDDDKFILCALSAKISTIISGDRDLLCLSGYEGLEILKPADFVRKHLI